MAIAFRRSGAPDSVDADGIDAPECFRAVWGTAVTRPKFRGLEPGLDELEWQVKAVCRGMSTDIFYYAETQRGALRKQYEVQAKQICNECPVRRPCAAYAMRTDEPHGVWGAMTTRERRVAMTRSRRKATTAERATS
ncbi:WhiB family transcriptional regulator [Mycobacteroides chelonae]|uniref:WhiB family transcriptional regulator n=1 Tax=Mycobacteroides chelonae TaxID=1774 RepID=UPI0007A10117|nr:WhiB family transcriptional regulator [Mycobacteroides chelonae]AMW22278.1 transcriptional regulator [Mycobacterium sp. QIA-37]AYM45013.1 WhiB family transcriptional regulator [[Mycobacterium] chelonae subsp. gwanakae]PKQ57782.1 transcription factor WhiB [Mycobacterium sp. MHSD3]MBF9523897.1 WhiB family transcriptional regulator [Mycobacteroides chelonae]MBV0919463.1 WhiB family transcriptional regulator [Mycobacteroides chelonae]